MVRARLQNLFKMMKFFKDSEEQVMSSRCLNISSILVKTGLENLLRFLESLPY